MKIKYCLGHISPQNKRCKDCTSDEKNKDCEDYKPINLCIYEVKEAEIK